MADKPDEKAQATNESIYIVCTVHMYYVYKKYGTITGMLNSSPSQNTSEPPLNTLRHII